jgi:arylsulfatase A
MARRSPKIPTARIGFENPANRFNSMTRHLILASLLLAGSGTGQTTLINATFDGVSNDTNPGFQIISNTQANGSGASWNQVTGLVNRGTATSSTAGAVSTTTIDIPSIDGDGTIVLTVNVESASGSLAANGMFIGFQQADGGPDAGGELWNNASPSFGLVIDGGNRLGQYTVAPGGNTSTVGFQDSPAFGITTSASINDGFTVTLTVSSAGWQFALTGLQDSGGAAISGGSGTWSDVPFAFSNFTSGMRAAFTTQGNGGGSLDLASVLVVGNTDAEPPPPNPGLVVPFVDSDGDSYRDQAETAMGSNPQDPADLPDYTPAPAKPNVVIIYADDLGFGDISRYGSLFGTPSPSPTPHVDSLADAGVTFTQAHSANAVCTPSRYSLLTGIYNWRSFQSISGHYGFKSGIDNIPSAGDVTLAHFLKSQGYDTAAFGKWHLGGKWYAPGTNTRITTNPETSSAVNWTRRVEGHATDIGFDYFRGLGAVINFGPYVYLHNDIVQYWVNDSGAGNTYGNKLPNGRKGYFRPATSSDTFTWLDTTTLNSTVVGAKDSRASLGDPSYRQIDAEPVMIADFEQYIQQRVTANDSDPFFAYVALYSPHKPWAITPAFNTSTYGSYDYARFMAEVDHRIGRILAAIDDNGMKDNTLVILTADNGPETTAMTSSLANADDSNGPLRGAKRDAWEGGTRVPFIVRWPGQAPAGMIVTDEVISQVDIFPTVAAFLGSELPATTAPDGESFLNVVRGQRKPGPARRGVVLCSINGHLALKSPDGWKLIDSTGGGGNSSSWDSRNNSIPNAIGTNRGTPKQLYHLSVDLGEDHNRIPSLTSESAIRSQLVTLTGRDLLGTLDQLRSNGAASLDSRVPDNDGDGMSNLFETTHGFDRDSPKDAALDHDGDGADNLAESIAGTDPNDPASVFRVIDLQNAPATLSVTWPSVAGRQYEVFWSSDLTAWTSHSTRTGSGAEVTASLDKSAIDAADGVPGNLRALFVKVTVAKP